MVCSSRSVRSGADDDPVRGRANALELLLLRMRVCAAVLASSPSGSPVSVSAVELWPSRRGLSDRVRIWGGVGAGPHRSVRELCWQPSYATPAQRYQLRQSRAVTVMVQCLCLNLAEIAVEFVEEMWPISDKCGTSGLRGLNSRPWDCETEALPAAPKPRRNVFAEGVAVSEKSR